MNIFELCKQSIWGRQCWSPVLHINSNLTHAWCDNVHQLPDSITSHFFKFNIVLRKNVAQANLKWSNTE